VLARGIPVPFANCGHHVLCDSISSQEPCPASANLPARGGYVAGIFVRRDRTLRHGRRKHIRRLAIRWWFPCATAAQNEPSCRTPRNVRGCVSSPIRGRKRRCRRRVTPRAAYVMSGGLLMVVGLGGAPYQWFRRAFGWSESLKTSASNVPHNRSADAVIAVTHYTAIDARLNGSLPLCSRVACRINRLPTHGLEARSSAGALQEIVAPLRRRHSQVIRTAAMMGESTLVAGTGWPICLGAPLPERAVPRDGAAIRLPVSGPELRGKLVAVDATRTCQ
jgi:hypothetical protein